MSNIIRNSIIVWFFVFIIVCGCWIGNVIKLIKCDFEPSYKGEIIHTIGLIPVVSVITVWNDDK